MMSLPPAFARTAVLAVVASTIASFGIDSAAVAQTPSTIGRVERLDDSLDDFLAADAKIEVLAAGFTWTEGPVWVPAQEDGQEDALLFSDIPRNTIYRWSESQGVELFLQPSGYTGNTYYGLEPGSNGLVLDAKGRLVMCEHGDRRVSVLTTDGGKQTIVDNYQGKRLNSPNDLVFDQTGNLYFTDPPYGLPERAEDKRRELDFCGVYRVSTSGEVTLLTDSIARPNGIGLSPDEKTLYVAQSDPQDPTWMAYPLKSDGTLGQRRVLGNASDAMQEFPGLPDGMAVHSKGTLFASGPGGIYVMNPDGKLLGRILTGGRTSNCTFDSDEKWLYMTADDKLCRIQIGH
ncbi:SMP-30/gluconolactonase/LRE family protein [Rhodopirellula sp. P2]|uniref:SMP-30/gluconolactonase/LRE family protein n=1 Tax=Rhodopirellula sp. P2 TaxID=2127060 RepID=UPI0023685951|nr:SMP-30/gluconolactonase/LRE family protein [Rhodopirellula sp. P2]WDQ16583.1 SMP-30/gluconolactonase/LRE family protein [Rhodopirellula sp. P2]